jgi:NhaA family Na+:H+ antiporter
VAEQLMAEGPERGEEATTALLGLADLALVAAPPGPRLEQRLRIWVNLAILPLFALANAGVHIGGVRLDARIFFGTLIGLCVGKAVGVVAATLGTSKAAGVPFPEGLTFRSLLVVGTSAGMGFAVSLFIAALAFTDPDLTASASLGVLAATALAGVATVVAGLVLVPRLPPPAGVLAEG